MGRHRSQLSVLRSSFAGFRFPPDVLSPYLTPEPFDACLGFDLAAAP